MSFSSDAGYSPSTISQLMLLVMANVNAQFGTTYEEATFIGTGFYKYFYSLIQELQKNEVKTSEIFLKLQQYFVVTNEEIQRPNTTRPGIISYFADRGYSASVKKPIDGDAGKLYTCVDVDNGAGDYAAVKLAVCNIIKDCCVAGVVSQGSESETITLSNDQSFAFKFALAEKTPILLKMTQVLSTSNQFTILSDAEIAALLFANINKKYRLGIDFEPQRYFSILDAPWASSVLVEYDIGAGFTSDIFTAEFDDLLTFAVTDISVVTM